VQELHYRTRGREGAKGLGAVARLGGIGGWGWCRGVGRSVVGSVGFGDVRGRVGLDGGGFQAGLQIFGHLAGVRHGLQQPTRVAGDQRHGIVGVCPESCQEREAVVDVVGGVGHEQHGHLVRETLEQLAQLLGDGIVPRRVLHLVQWESVGRRGLDHVDAVVGRAVARPGLLERLVVGLDDGVDDRSIETVVALHAHEGQGPHHAGDGG